MVPRSFPHPAYSIPSGQKKRSLYTSYGLAKRDVPSACSLNGTTPACLQAIYQIPATPNVNSNNRIGVTGFCLGGGLSFLTACKFSDEIAAAAPFYGMVLDEWIDAVKDITVPVHLFFGGIDPFIPRDRIRQIESRFQELGKDYTLKVYPDAGHGFFCHEHSDYKPSAAEDAWLQLTRFFKRHLHRKS